MPARSRALRMAARKSSGIYTRSKGIATSPARVG